MGWGGKQTLTLFLLGFWVARQNCARYSLSVGFILGGGGCLALLGLVVLAVACGSRQRGATDPETPEVRSTWPIICGPAFRTFLSRSCT